VRVDHEPDHRRSGGHPDGDAAAQPGHGLGPATGLGLRLGANIGYLKYTPRATWNPF